MGEERDEGPRTMGSRLDGNGTGVSPLQGTKIVIQNLQTSVTQEDILELFGDSGDLPQQAAGWETHEVHHGWGQQCCCCNRRSNDGIAKDGFAYRQREERSHS